MFTDLLFRLRALFRRNNVEAELHAELRAHLENEIAKCVAAGVPRDEAANPAVPTSSKQPSKTPGTPSACSVRIPVSPPSLSSRSPSAWAQTLQLSDWSIP